jgi:uncharacterized membrane protein
MYGVHFSHITPKMMSRGYAVAVACLAASLAAVSAFSLKGMFDAEDRLVQLG